MPRGHRAGTLGVPARAVLVVLAALALLAAACGDDGTSTTTEAGGPAGFTRDPAPEVGDLEFVDFAGDPAGAPFALAAPTEGGYLLHYFGYLSCPDVCPLTLSELSQARDLLPADLAARTSVSMVTFDPQRDTGAEIADYMANFFPAGAYHALRADDDDVLATAGDRLAATWRREEQEPGADPDAYFMAHTADVYVLDDQGRMLWEFPYGTEPADIAEALEALDAGET